MFFLYEIQRFSWKPHKNIYPKLTLYGNVKYLVHIFHVQHYLKGLYLLIYWWFYKQFQLNLYHCIYLYVVYMFQLLKYLYIHFVFSESLIIWFQLKDLKHVDTEYIFSQLLVRFSGLSMKCIPYAFISALNHRWWWR